MKINIKKLLVILSLALIIGTITPAAIGCEPSFSLKVVNGTDQVLTIYYYVSRSERPVRLGDVEPGEDIKFPHLWVAENPYQVIAKNDRGETVYSREFDYFELQDDYKFKVVIKLSKEESLEITPSRLPCQKTRGLLKASALTVPAFTTTMPVTMTL